MKRTHSLKKATKTVLLLMPVIMMWGCQQEQQATFSMDNSIKQVPEVEVKVDCLNIASSLQRLQCFDQHFETPLATVIHSTQEGETQQVPSWERSSDKRVRFLHRQLKKQPPSKTAVSFATDDTADSKRLLLIVSASTATENNQPLTERVPVLIFQCYQDISSVQLLWPTDLQHDQIKLRIWSQQTLLLESTWRVLDETFLITSPRGLPGVTIIKRLFHHPQLTFESRTKNARFKATFSVEQLKQHITPLGKACHWL